VRSILFRKIVQEINVYIQGKIEILNQEYLNYVISKVELNCKIYLFVICKIF